MYYNGKLVITHHDLKDENQTIHIPECSTDAKDGKTGTKTGKAEPDAEVKDTVAYSNLIPGEEYVAKGVLMDKESGEPIRDENNNEITGTAAFVPETADGLIDVYFKFDASGLRDKTVVVFEEVFQGAYAAGVDGAAEGAAVLVHQDINDSNQAVSFIYEEPDQPPTIPPENVTPPEKVTPPTPTPPSDMTPPTGDSISIVLLVIVSMAAAVGALVVERKKRKK